MKFALSAYLDRLELDTPGAGEEGLRRLTWAHMSHIPFENTEPLLGRVPSLEEGALVDKLITRRRGGYCFEHNALFGRALAAAGFAARPVLGRVRNGNPRGGARTHQAQVVTIGAQEFLCDVGFGGAAPVAPIPMDGAVHDIANGSYRVGRDPETGETTMERRRGAGWEVLWGYDDIPLYPEDFETGNLVAATWEAAPFHRYLMAAFHGPDGRVALFNRALSLGMPPSHERALIEDRAALAEVLRGAFTLALDEAEIDAIWARIETAPTTR